MEPSTPTSETVVTTTPVATPDTGSILPRSEISVGADRVAAEVSATLAVLRRRRARLRRGLRFGGSAVLSALGTVAAVLSLHSWWDTSPRSTSVARASLGPVRKGADPSWSSPRVDDAIGAGEIRALDLSLVWVPSPSRPVSWARARATCASGRVAGVDGWELPSLDELRRLQYARLVPAGRFWSSSEVDERPGAYWASSAEEPRPVTHRIGPSGVAGTVCVRLRSQA